MWRKQKDNNNMSASDIEFINMKNSEAQKEISILMEYQESFCPVIVNQWGKDKTHNPYYNKRHNELLSEAIDGKINSINKILKAWIFTNGKWINFI